MTSLDVRTYEPADAEAVWDLHERALRDAGTFDPELIHLDSDLRRIPEEYLEAGGTFLVGEAGGAIVAMGAVRPLSALEAWAGEAGLETLVLDTRPTQEAAIAFYEHHGYQRVESASTDYGPVLFYRKRLAG